MEDDEIIRRSFDESTVVEFERRVERQAEFLKDEIQTGSLDSSDFTVGLEIEVYGVGEDGGLVRVPDEVFEVESVSKELGLHNAEINSSPVVLSDEGLRRQEDEVRHVLEEARTASDTDLVLDSVWTLPPDEGSKKYLDDVDERGSYVYARNMRVDPRYHAIDNYYLAKSGKASLDVPGASHDFKTILYESLATSLQPHLQIPDVDELAPYYNTAIRTMPAVLALTTNSPFLPPDLYNDVDDPESFVDETPHELRIPIFEQSVNPGDEYGDKKVRVPRDIDTPDDVVDRVTEDCLYAPVLKEWFEDGDGSDEEYTDSFWEFDYRRGTYWRWLRAVIGGDYVDENNDEKSVRIEYRPVPTQPTVEEIVGVQAVVSGLIIGLVREDHPVSRLDWEKTRDDFYSVVEEGLDANIGWIDEDGNETRDKEVIYDEVFEYAERGLVSEGVEEETVEEYLMPLRRRWEKKMTPSVWKKDTVREALEDGLSLDEAIRRMQSEYIRLSREGRRVDGFV